MKKKERMNLTKNENVKEGKMLEKKIKTGKIRKIILLRRRNLKEEDMKDKEIKERKNEEK